MQDQDRPQKPRMFHHAPPKSFQYAEQNRESPTYAEAILWKALKDKRLGGFKFRRQHPIHKYILDFYCHAARLAVEVDGGYHQNVEQQDYDARRTADLLEIGVSVIRFTNEEVINDLGGVLAAVLGALAPNP
ncbi:MAG: endonuclease domain-containing protein [Bacteroidota bacterium]